MRLEALQADESISTCVVDVKTCMYQTRKVLIDEVLHAGNANKETVRIYMYICMLLLTLCM